MQMVPRSCKKCAAKDAKTWLPVAASFMTEAAIGTELLLHMCRKCCVDVAGGVFKTACDDCVSDYPKLLWMSTLRIVAGIGGGLLICVVAEIVMCSRVPR